MIYFILGVSISLNVIFSSIAIFILKKKNFIKNNIDFATFDKNARQDFMGF